MELRYICGFRNLGSENAGGMNFALNSGVPEFEIWVPRSGFRDLGSENLVDSRDFCLVRRFSRDPPFLPGGEHLEFRLTLMCSGVF